MIYIWNKIKAERSVLLFLTLLSAIRAMHEISKFRYNWSWLPKWDYPFGITSPPFDSYHVYGGLFILTIIAGYRLQLRKVIDKWYESAAIVIVEYVFFFWVFNLFYHVIFMKAEFMQWEYVIPFMKFLE